MANPAKIPNVKIRYSLQCFFWTQYTIFKNVSWGHIPALLLP